MQPTHIEKSWILQLKSPAFLEIFNSTELIITLKHPDYYFDKIYFTEFGEFWYLSSAQSSAFCLSMSFFNFSNILEHVVNLSLPTVTEY
jgi:hypothetical protein